MRSFSSAKAAYIFSAENGSVFIYNCSNTFENFIMLTHHVIGFEQLIFDALIQFYDMF